MQVNRSHILLVGLLLFFTGVQLRLVKSFTLSERSSRFIAAQMGDKQSLATSPWPSVAARKVVEPPGWLGLALMSVGSVLTLKCLAMAAGSGPKAAGHG